MLQLHSPEHSLPDNIWHTALIAAVSFLLIWGGIRQYVEHLDKVPAHSALHSGQEIALMEGEGQAVYATVEIILPDHPLLLNRILSGLGWLASLVMVGRILTRLSGFMLALPSVLILMAFPGLTPWMLAGGSGSPGMFLFLLGFSSLVLEDMPENWIRGGVYAGLGAMLYPALALPSLAIVVATAEWDRTRTLRAGIGYGVTLLAGSVFFGLLSPYGLQGLTGSYPRNFVDHEEFGSLFLQSVFLIAAAGLLLWFGARKRGMIWWGLCTALVVGLFSDRSHPYGWVPFLVLLSLGLVKVPVLLNIRHPRSIQSVLLCQLMLWVPLILS